MSAIWLVRHGATEWSSEGRHTSVTDLALLPEGEAAARALEPRLVDGDFDAVYTSPRKRARLTAELAGFPDALVDADLAEWDYGDFEGLTTAQIRTTHPGWSIWHGPWPGGEQPEQVAARADRVISHAREHKGRTLVFAHGHLLRVLAARWLGLGPSEGRLFALDTATIGVLGTEHETPAMLRWNS